MAVSFELDLDQRFIKRQYPTVLDLLASVGGLDFMLVSVMALLLQVSPCRDSIDSYLIKALYHFNKEHRSGLGKSSSQFLSSVADSGAISNTSI